MVCTVPRNFELSPFKCASFQQALRYEPALDGRKDGLQYGRSMVRATYRAHEVNLSLNTLKPQSNGPLYSNVYTGR